jgi:hypothetical protein
VLATIMVSLSRMGNVSYHTDSDYIGMEIWKETVDDHSFNFNFGIIIFWIHDIIGKQIAIEQHKLVSKLRSL